MVNKFFKNKSGLHSKPWNFSRMQQVHLAMVPFLKHIGSTDVGLTPCPSSISLGKNCFPLC